MIAADLYEISMAASYARRGMVEPATFSLFVRNLPAGRGFLVAAGLETALDGLRAFEVTDDDVRRLADLFGCAASFLKPLSGLRFTGSVVAVPEGRVLFAGEPLLEVTAPLPQAQLVEGLVLNALTYQTAVATKAVRCVTAAAGRPVVDFSLRRTHGLEAADAVARVSAIAGFAATSNIRAAARYGLQATGTMAHSYVQAFGDDESAFRAFAADVPVSPTFLVDTFDLASGVRAAARVITELGLGRTAAVRIDSGDLAAGAHLARTLLDRAGLLQVRIVVSGGLDEHGIAALSSAGAPVDVYAVGTALGVSADAPSLDTAYELVQLDHHPVLKLSEGKATLPGAKQVWRRRLGPGPVDVLSLRDEAPLADGEPLLLPVMHDGERLRRSVLVADAHDRLRHDLALLPPAALALTRPCAPTCIVSPRLGRLADHLRTAARPRPTATGPRRRAPQAQGAPGGPSVTAREA
jgi:nicotinate phosphoribosyltransferase